MNSEPGANINLMMNAAGQPMQVFNGVSNGYGQGFLYTPIPGETSAADKATWK